MPMAPRLAVLALTLITLCGTAAAQPPRPQGVSQPPQTGTATIRGRIIAADTGRPLRRAQIALAAFESGGQGRTTTTTADGRYQFKDLPAGRYTLTVQRSGFLTLRYGQRRPLEPAKPLQVLDRQSVENVDFALPRMSVIAGRVTDETADPISGVQVLAMRWAYFEGRRRIVPAGGGRAQKLTMPASIGSRVSRRAPISCWRRRAKPGP